jgi:RNA 3'-terminal phosphate cyclase
LIDRGFYPKGNGSVTLRTKAIQYIQPIIIEDFGKLQKIEIFGYYAGSITDNVRYIL